MADFSSQEIFACSKTIQSTILHLTEISRQSSKHEQYNTLIHMQVSQGSDLALRVRVFFLFMCILFLLFTATKRQNIYHTGAQTINQRNCSLMYVSCIVFSSAFHSFPVLFFQNDSSYIIKNEVKLRASSRRHLQLHWIFALPAALS